MARVVDGFVNVDKPEGVTSREVVNAVSKRLGTKRAGHVGTLDPLATGVVVVAVGNATRLVSYMHEQSKTYVTSFRFGVRSSTDDLEGELIETLPQAYEVPSRTAVERLIAERFTGEIDQVPPQYSAVKVAGKRSYHLARRGRSVDLKPRKIVIHRIDVRRFEFPELDLFIHCGSGTYIRSIARDLGDLLGCGAVMTALRRTSVGGFRIEDATSFDRLWTPFPPSQQPTAAVCEQLLGPESVRLYSASMGVAHIPQRVASDHEWQELCFGRRIPITAEDEALLGHDRRIVLINSAGEFFAVVEPAPIKPSTAAASVDRPDLNTTRDASPTMTRNELPIVPATELSSVIVYRQFNARRAAPAVPLLETRLSEPTAHVSQEAASCDDNAGNDCSASIDHNGD